MATRSYISSASARAVVSRLGSARSAAHPAAVLPRSAASLAPCSDKIRSAGFASVASIGRGSSPAGLLLCRAQTPAAASAVAEAPAEPRPIYLKDYAPPPYSISNVDLKFELGEEGTTVTSTMEISLQGEAGSALSLIADEMELLGAKLNGEALAGGAYSASSSNFTLKLPPSEAFTLELTTLIHPETNTKLEGLYKSSGNFCTQCEAEGFRRITYFLDQPDVMALYTSTVVADKSKYPVLLSNGNLIDSGDMEGGMHFAVWEDPFPKPSYLFALVAGDLAKIEDKFTTMSGREVSLAIYCQEHNIHKCDYAMDALKRSMKWDEDVYGLEYDLDLFNIVAVDDFNMGAMENKSLNVFNSRLVLATPDTATDGDYSGIERVVAHEYFHNWTGNRVTCRDWFQLSLKEGLTVFRDQEFTADMNSRGVKRISDVAGLRASQFPQDAGPMAHPVRPDSYIKMDNFYTVTVYNKGAEVVRMYHTLLGPEGFRKGMDLYFERHDGCAVTCDDFRAAMADANEVDLSQFSRWYSQAGTPRLDIKSSYDATAQTLTLECTQSCPATPGQPEKEPFLLPVKVGLVGSESGKPIAVDDSGALEVVLKMTEAKQTFTFTGIAERPIPSPLRGFSAPVVLSTDLSKEDRTFLVANDTDEFNRWEMLQTLSRELMLSLLEDHNAGKEMQMDMDLVEAVRAIITDPSVDPAFKTCVLSLPGEGEISEMVTPADPAAIHEVRDFVVRSMAEAMESDLRSIFEECSPAPSAPYELDFASKAKRSLRNTCLALMAKLKTPEVTELCAKCYKDATNMTDSFASLAAAAGIEGEQREQLLADFYEKWQEDPLVVNKWLGLQAASNVENNLANVRALMDHPAFDIANPNKVYSLLGGFCSSSVNFHAADGSGYTFLADVVLKLDSLNAQVASRMVGAFTRWKKYDFVRSEAMKAELERILAAKENGKLSPNTYEIVSKSLE